MESKCLSDLVETGPSENNIVVSQWLRSSKKNKKYIDGKRKFLYSAVDMGRRLKRLQDERKRHLDIVREQTALLNGQRKITHDLNLQDVLLNIVEVKGLRTREGYPKFRKVSGGGFIGPNGRLYTRSQLRFGSDGFVYTLDGRNLGSFSPETIADLKEPRSSLSKRHTTGSMVSSRFSSGSLTSSLSASLTKKRHRSRGIQRDMANEFMERDDAEDFSSTSLDSQRKHLYRKNKGSAQDSTESLRLRHEQRLKRSQLKHEQAMDDEAELDSISQRGKDALVKKGRRTQSEESSSDSSSFGSDRSPSRFSEHRPIPLEFSADLMENSKQAEILREIQDHLRTRGGKFAHATHPDPDLQLLLKAFKDQQRKQERKQFGLSISRSRDDVLVTTDLDGRLNIIHPVLGCLGAKEAITLQEHTDVWSERDYLCQSFYDSEIYSVCEDEIEPVNYSIRKIEPMTLEDFQDKKQLIEKRKYSSVGPYAMKWVCKALKRS